MNHPKFADGLWGIGPPGSGCARFEHGSWLLSLALLAIGNPLDAAQPVVAPRPLEFVVARVGADYIREAPHALLVIGVSSPHGRRVWGFGRMGDLNPKDSARPDGDTLFEIGSITKTMTGTLLAELVIQGEVQLDDPVRAHFPADWSIPRRDGRDISLLHLATHTSSLPRMPPDFLGFLVVEAFTGNFTWNDPYSDYRMAELKTSLAKVELPRPIGSRMVYSNLGVGLLGQGLARAAHYDDPAPLFEERLLKPLGMTDTYFEVPEKSRDRLAPPFHADGTPAHAWHMAALKAAGGLRSSVNDLLRYGEAATGRVKTPLQPAFDFALQRWREIESDRFIGLCWFMRPVELPEGGGATTTLVWHNGGTGGYRSFIALFPERQTTVVVLANTTKQLDPDFTWPILSAILTDF